MNAKADPRGKQIIINEQCMITLDYNQFKIFISECLDEMLNLFGIQKISPNLQNMIMDASDLRLTY